MVAQPREEDSAPRAGRWRLGLVVLLAFLAVGLAAGISLRMYSERSEWSSVSTAIGDYRRLPLSDGSTLELNTATEVRYRLSEHVRLLDLTIGEARFRVAHDPSRPFVVFAGDTVVRAVGTEFTVRIRDNGKVDVVVAEGVVAVSHRERDSVIGELLYGLKIPLAGGTPIPEKRVLTDDRGRFSVAEMTRARIEARDAWRNNLLVFEDMPLSQIVDEFNRYNRQKLEIAGSTLGIRRMGGRYQPRDVDRFLENLSMVVSIRVVTEEGENGPVRRIHVAEQAGVTQ